jgi:glucosamine kinase
MPLYLAIDAGGTKTNCLLADDTRILARASTGTIKLMRVSEEEATARLQAVLEQVATVANVSLAGVTRTCFGLAGISNPAVQTWARQIVPAKVAGEFLLVGDEEIALDAAFPGGPGILVIAGTGSNIIGRDAAGKLFGTGGWGPVLGDEGSGYWIGLEALRAALRAQDRIGLDGISSCLLRDIEVHWQLDSLAELVAMANQRTGFRRPAPDFATLAPVVADCAKRGDGLAAGVLERAGEELADQVTLVYQKMARPIPRKLTIAGSTPECPTPQPAQEIGVAFTGSVLSEITAVQTAMIARLAASLPTAQVRETPVDPLEGALWRARHG